MLFSGRLREAPGEIAPEGRLERGEHEARDRVDHLLMEERIRRRGAHAIVEQDRPVVEIEMAILLAVATVAGIDLEDVAREAGLDRFVGHVHGRD